MDDNLNKYDAIIIGAGPAGLSAAIYIARANRGALVVGSGTSTLAKVEKIENYFGFENAVSGKALLEQGEKQAKRLGVEIITGEITSLEQDGEKFTASGIGEAVYSAKAVLLATGQPPRRPDIPGVHEYEGKGVSYCTTCDGFFFRNKKVGVLGSGNYAVQEASELDRFSSDITIFTNAQPAGISGGYAQKAKNYKINASPIKKLFGENGVLKGIETADGPLPLDGIFIASGTASSADFALKLGILMKDGSIVTDENRMTNIEGIFAAGDCTGGLKQVSTAVGFGALAGVSIVKYLKNR